MIIYINGRGMNAPELKAYISELEAENAELRAKVESAERQKAEYDDELRKAKKLLRAAVEGLDNCADRCICDYCDSRCPFYNFGCVSGWKHRDEALALIGEEGESNV